MVKVGARLACPECPTEVVVTRATDASIALTCSGQGLVGLDEDRAQGGHSEAAAEPAQLGKRYVDEDSGTELLCTKPGTGQLGCDGRPVSLKSAKPLPSSD